MGGVCLGWKGLVAVGDLAARSGSRGGTTWAWFGEWASIRAAIVTVMAEF
jgi:hypothetical protein